MQTRIVLLALLSAAPAPAPGQVPTSAAVMRIDPATQRQRDETRVVILQNELVAEALALADAQKVLASQPPRTDVRAAQEASQRIARHRQNISALAKELANADRLGASTTSKSAPVPVVTSPQQRIAEDWLLGSPPAVPAAPPQARRAVPEQPEKASNSSRAPEWLIPAAR